MARIGLAMFPEPGHHIPTFPLATSLQEQGHEVRYLALSAMGPWVTAQGFACTTVLRGLHEEVPLEILLLGRAFELELRAARLDLLLVDSLLYYVRMAAEHIGLPAVRITTSLPQEGEQGVPPLDTSLPYGDTPERLAAVEEAWRAHPGRVASYPDWVLLPELMARYGWTEERLDRRSTFSPSLQGGLELVMCSPALDFPRAPRPGRHAVESLWLQRPEVPFPWDKLDGRPLVYCARGTQSPSCARLYEATLGAARELPHLQFVVAADGWAPHHPDDHVLVVPHAPQIELLKRAALFLTHGGLGSIKEAVFFGVPMVVFPGKVDQHGNAARVVHHGLGRAGDAETVTAAGLAALVTEVLQDPAVRPAVARLQREIVALEEARPGLALVQEALAHR
jgi:zeaxanthin glucosyltransferase